MSTRERLSRLTADLLAPQPNTTVPSIPVLPVVTAAPADVPDDINIGSVETRFPDVVARQAGRKTGPGELLAFRGQMLAAEGELARLKEALQRYDGSMPTRKIDAAQIHPSRWSNRHDASFTNADFIRFKADIAQAGGNVQPILVRQVEEGVAKFEIVFGHRRHRACLELGLPVLAVVTTEPMSDMELFAAMDRENRERADLSAWEQGAMYRKALDEQMFPSQRRLAEALGLSHTWVRKAIAVADLPEPVVECFRSPLELQFKHAEQINEAMILDRKGVLRRAEKLRLSARMPASSVVSTLVGKNIGGTETSQEIRVAGKVVGKIGWDARGQATIRLQPGILHSENVAALMEAIASVVQSGTERT